MFSVDFTSFTIVLGVIPGAPGFGVGFAVMGAGYRLACVGGAPKAQIVVVGQLVARPGVDALVADVVAKVADGVKGGQFLGTVGMLPARKIREAVFDFYVVLMEDIAVFHVARSDLTVQGPVLGLGFDVDLIVGYDEIDQSAFVLILVAALNGVILPVAVVVVAVGLVAALKGEGTVVGLLNEASLVVVVDEIGEPVY